MDKTTGTSGGLVSVYAGAWAARFFYLAQSGCFGTRLMSFRQIDEKAFFALDISLKIRYILLYRIISECRSRFR
jgi:hypothetical protein